MAQAATFFFQAAGADLYGSVPAAWLFCFSRLDVLALGRLKCQDRTGARCGFSKGALGLAGRPSACLTDACFSRWRP